MKISFLIRSLDIGGAERQLVNLSLQLAQRGHNIQILTFYPGGVLESQLQGSTVQCVSLNKKGRWDVFGFLIRLVNHLKKNKPDILHSYLTVPNILAACLKPLFSNLKIVYGLRTSFINYAQYDSLTRLTSFLEAKVFRFADCVIFNSKAGYCDALKRGFKLVPHAIIFNGINTEQFCFDLAKRNALRAMLKVERDAYLIGIVARLDPIKGHEVFFKLAQLLTQKFPKIFFVCVGEGPAAYRQHLNALLLQYGIGDKLFWLEGQNEVSGIYSALDLLCSTSFGEGFSNVLAEAMACGTPCVATEVGDTKEILGPFGGVAPLQDMTALFSEAVRLLENRQSLERVILRKRIEDCFSLEKMTDDTEHVLNELLCIDRM